jgi:anti-sigma regulatory factor (Ser/Thr protein kinase)
MHISRSATNIVEVAAKAVQAFSKCAAEKSLSLETNAGACISRVYVDSQRIYQVFSNLITNAIKYTDKGGKICISVFERDDEVVTVVEDTGVGIAAEHQRHIFNKFYQIARRAGPGYSGSGLGLALSKEIVVTHGGKMWVESEPGKGSKFYFSLPKVKPQIILHKHLGVTAQRAHKKGERFAVLVVRLETSDSYEEQHRQALEAAMKQIMLVGDELTMASSDLVIRKGELEAVLVISQTGKRYLGYVRKKLRDAIFDVLKDYPFNCDPILPMLGIAIYPSDAAAVEEIEKIAASEMNRIL